VEIVSRFPDDADGADVVEVIGRVQTPPGAVPGESRLTYEVVENPHKDRPLGVRKDVLKMVSKPGNVLLVAKDCFGHRYTVDVLDGVRNALGNGSVDILRSGQGAVTLRTYDVMRPTSGTPIGAPDGALRHLFGVHGYLTVWAWTDAVSLDLRINNAASGLDKSDPDDDPLGKAYFESLELWVPTGWEVVPDFKDPFWGNSRPEGNWTAFELVRPLPGGNMHMMPAQSSMHRRVALAKTANVSIAQSVVEEEWLGFNERGNSPSGGELYSWWNKSTPAYFPQRHRLPELDYLGFAKVNNSVMQAYNRAKNVLESGKTNGNYPYASNVLGWAHPIEVPYGGMTGGGNIYLYDGFRTAEVGSRLGYKAMQIDHRMAVSRQADKLYDKDGSPTNVESWVVNGSQFKYVPMTFFQVLLPGSPDPFGMSTSPGFQRAYVAANDMQPGYEAALLNHMPLDLQHYIRFTRSPKKLAWLGNDPIAKDDLRAAAEIFRLSYHEHATSAGGGYIGTGLLDDINFVAQFPGKGVMFGRGESWGIDSVMSAYSTAYDEEWRAQTLPYLQKIADVIVQGQSSCNKIVQSLTWTSKVGNLVGGQYRTRQSIEQAITEHMLYGLNASVFRGVDPGREAGLDYVLTESTKAMIGPMCWSNGANGGIGPHALIAVGPSNLNQQPFCTLVGAGNGIDRTMIWSSFAYGYEKTGDPEFFNKASLLADNFTSGGGTLWSKMADMGFNMLEMRMALVADLQ
jgi:hypothetical protein